MIGRATKEREIYLKRLIVMEMGTWTLHVLLEEICGWFCLLKVVPRATRFRKISQLQSVKLLQVSFLGPTLLGIYFYHGLAFAGQQSSTR